MEKVIRVRFYMRNGSVIDDNSMILKDDASESDIANKVDEIRSYLNQAVGQSRDGYISLGFTYVSAKDIVAVQLSGSAFDVTSDG